MSIDDLIVELKFFVPSKKLTERILDLNERYLNPGKEPRRRKIIGWGRGRNIAEQQRTIGERLYRQLAATARCRDNSEECFSIFEWVPRGMAVNLGFPSHSEIDFQSEIGRRTSDVLIALAQEFRSWLIAHPNGYQAPWGDLWIIEGDRFGLTALNRRDLVPHGRHEQTPTVQSVGELITFAKVNL